MDPAFDDILAHNPYDYNESNNNRNSGDVKKHAQFAGECFSGLHKQSDKCEFGEPKRDCQSESEPELKLKTRVSSISTFSKDCRPALTINITLQATMIVLTSSGLYVAGSRFISKVLGLLLFKLVSLGSRPGQRVATTSSPDYISDPNNLLVEEVNRYKYGDVKSA